MVRMASSTSGGSSVMRASSWLLLITSASSSRAALIWSFCAGGITVLSCTWLVKLNDSAASITPPATARPKDRPKLPEAEFTPAASLMRSSATGASV